MHETTPAQVELRLIEIAWSGPHTRAECLALRGPGDRGVIQVYGTHPVFGDDSLLFIGRGFEMRFGGAVEALEPWLRFLPSEPAFYLGRLGAAAPVDEAAWSALTEAAERLLVFFHSPPWNSKGVDQHGVAEPTLVLNLGRSHRLAIEVSTLWSTSSWDPDGGPWRPFEPLPREEP